MVDPLVPDVLAQGLKLVFCGTALGRASFERRAYYANPGNQFWAALARAGVVERRLRPEEYPLLLERGMGLTDLSKTHVGNDDELPPEAFDPRAFREKILHYQPRWVAFTSKKAASVYSGRRVGKIQYGVQAEVIGATGLYVLPSPSGLARRWWKEEVWQGLGALVAEA